MTLVRSGHEEPHWIAEHVVAQSCEIRESAETASVLAVLDATNRWIAHTR